MQRSGFLLAFGGACAILAGLGVWARGGELDPPAGPIAPTMKTLDDISAQISSLQVATGGAPIKRVIHGVISFTAGQSQKSQSFSPSIDPSKAMVVLSPSVYISNDTAPNSLHARNGACLIELTADSLGVAVDARPGMVQQVSFQIIEYH